MSTERAAQPDRRNTASESMAAPIISVIIPVFKDWDRLSRCVASLERQSLSRDQYEILVVSNELTRDSLDQWQQTSVLNGIRTFHEPRGYSYAARNLAAAEAQGQLLAFTDADCEPEADWLSKALSYLRSAPQVVSGGKVVVSLQGAMTLAARYDIQFGLRQDYYLNAFGGMATANMVVCRALFWKINGFDAVLPSGGDFDFCRRAKQAGFGLSYRDDMVVNHAARTSWAQIFSQNRRHALGSISMSWYRSRRQKLALLRQLWRLWRPPWREWRALVSARDPRTAGLEFEKRLVLGMLRVMLHYHRASVSTRAMYRMPEKKYG